MSCKFCGTTTSTNHRRNSRYQSNIFGARDSPACAIYALQQAARHNPKNYPDIIDTVITDFYLDNFGISVGSTEEALQLHQRLRHVLGSHSFNLMKWCINSRTICSELDESLLTTRKTKSSQRTAGKRYWEFPGSHSPTCLQLT